MSRGSSAAHRIEDPMAETFRDRLFRAWQLLQVRQQGILSQAWLGAEVGRELGAAEPVTQSTISKWMSGASAPQDTDTMVALAKVLEVDPGWLTFGAASKAPAPHDPFKQGMQSLPQPDED
jgi:transcriptional regulator with XRE-family HTH domain